jgi:anti-sigma B factor antagonist
MTTVDTSVTDGVSVIRLHGDLDSQSAGFVQEQLATLIPIGGKALLDMTEVPYMSSAGLRTMVLVYRHAHRVGSDIALVGVSEDLRAVMRATGFLDFFVLADDIAGAVQELTA